MPIEDDYLDVLQNIEFAIVSVFREHPDIADFVVMRALDAAISWYNAERRGHQPKLPSLADADRLVYERVMEICELQLGRGNELITE